MKMWTEKNAQESWLYEKEVERGYVLEAKEYLKPPKSGTARNVFL